MFIISTCVLLAACHAWARTGLSALSTSADTCHVWRMTVPVPACVLRRGSHVAGSAGFLSFTLAGGAVLLYCHQS